MTKTIPKSIFLVIALVAFASMMMFGATKTMAQGDAPDWFRGVASFWAEGNISTAEFLDSIEFLLQEEVIQVDGFGPISEAQAVGVDQKSLDEIWNAINSLQEQTVQQSDPVKVDVTILDEGCSPNEVIKYVSGTWICSEDYYFVPEIYVKMNTAKGTAVVQCDAPSFHNVIGGGGIPSTGTTLEKSFPTGTGAFGIPIERERPTGWAASSSDTNADVTVFVVCLGPK